MQFELVNDASDKMVGIVTESFTRERILAWDGYRNCKRQRKRGAKICLGCPFKPVMESLERGF